MHVHSFLCFPAVLHLSDSMWLWLTTSVLLCCGANEYTNITMTTHIFSVCVCVRAHLCVWFVELLAILSVLIKATCFLSSSVQAVLLLPQQLPRECGWKIHTHFHTHSNNLHFIFPGLLLVCIFFSL